VARRCNQRWHLFFAGDCDVFCVCRDGAAALGGRPHRSVLGFLGPVLTNLGTWGLPALTLGVGVAEFFLGLYDRRWTRNEQLLDAVCFVGSKLLVRPFVVYFTLRAMPVLFPDGKGLFSWVPFWWGFFIIAVADDLTQYWYHRLHHQVPWLWRFHRTHHSAPGDATAARPKGHN
jgi:sterol desaturase/sphingolipid hydroxylase (fatty acid hydroxylase superfamily)